MNSDQIYDIAVSFAGEQRDYVAQTVTACKALGLRVFYDKDKNNDWWGNSFIRDQRVVYSSRTRYFVPFISAEYLSKPIPMDEFSAAMMTAVKLGDGYILPVLMDDVEVPAELLHPHIGYLRSRDYTPSQLAEQIQQRVGAASKAGQAPAELGTVVSEALAVRMPKITPDSWSKYTELKGASPKVPASLDRKVSCAQSGRKATCWLFGLSVTARPWLDSTSARACRWAMILLPGASVYRGALAGIVTMAGRRRNSISRREDRSLRSLTWRHRLADMDPETQTQTQTQTQTVA
jgi:hypothetical protein